MLLLFQSGNRASLDSGVVKKPLGQEVYGVAWLGLVEHGQALCDDQAEVVSLDVSRIGVLFGFSGRCSRHVVVGHSLF